VTLQGLRHPGKPPSQSAASTRRTTELGRLAERHSVSGEPKEAKGRLKYVPPEDVLLHTIENAVAKALRGLLCRTPPLAYWKMCRSEGCTKAVESANFTRTTNLSWHMLIRNRSSATFVAQRLLRRTGLSRPRTRHVRLSYSSLLRHLPGSDASLGSSSVEKAPSRKRSHVIRLARLT
jgi:hypothetical protein